LIRFSSAELALLQDADVLLLKRQALEKVEAALTSLIPLFQDSSAVLFNRFPEFAGQAPKLSRGENYRSLPYRVLDYPRFADGEDLFLFRSMFWWGHFYSFTLHLQGRYWEKMKEKFIRYSFPEDTNVCVGDTPWEYHYGPENYLPLQQADMERVLARPFLKLSLPLPLPCQAEEMQDFGREAFRILTGFMSEPLND
jgi:hypothetical protein